MMGDILRWVNVALAALVVAALLAGAMKRWDHMPKRFKRITPWVVMTYVVIAYGSGEIATSDTDFPIGIRVGMMLIVLLGLLIALLYRIDDDDYQH